MRHAHHGSLKEPVKVRRTRHLRGHAARRAVRSDRMRYIQRFGRQPWTPLSTVSSTNPGNKCHYVAVITATFSGFMKASFRPSRPRTFTVFDPAPQPCSAPSRTTPPSTWRRSRRPTPWRPASGFTGDRDHRARRRAGNLRRRTTSEFHDASSPNARRFVALEGRAFVVPGWSGLPQYRWDRRSPAIWAWSPGTAVTWVFRPVAHRIDARRRMSRVGCGHGGPRQRIMTKRRGADAGGCPGCWQPRRIDATPGAHDLTVIAGHLVGRSHARRSIMATQNAVCSYFKWLRR